MKSSEVIFVAGATGQTGGFTARILLKQGRKVRALVRKEDNRSRKLASLGAEIFIGDLSDFQSVRKALVGVTSAYFVWPVLPGNIEAASFFIQAAKENKVGHVVNISHILTRKDSPSLHSQYQWIAERMFDESGLNVTHLRPTIFADWIVQQASSIALFGVFASPFQGENKVALVCAEDQARVIAEILMNPSKNVGKSYDLYGVEEKTFDNICEEIGTALGYKVAYIGFTPAGFAQFGRVIGAPPFTIQHVCKGGAIDFQTGMFSGRNNIIKEITGEYPMTMTEYVLKNRELFKAPWYKFW